MNISQVSKQASDESLIQYFKTTQDQNSIGILYQRYVKMVERQCQKYYQDAATCQDLTMDIFEQLPKKLIAHEVRNFKSWIFCVTRNHCLKQLRHRQYFHSIEDNSDHIPAAASAPPSESSKTQKINQLMQSLKALSPEQQQCIELFFFQKYSYAEISSMLKIKVKHVKSHIQNGKLKLKRMLK